MNSLDGSAEVRLRPGLQLSVGGGAAWLSDNNSRTSGLLALTQTLRRRFTVGLMGRRMGYDFKGTGYFSPDRFTVVEARGSYAFSNRLWSARVTAGLGLQQVTSTASSQSEWHFDARGGRTWGFGTVEVFAGISNSLESSTTGAFRYRTAGILARFGI